MKNNNMEKSYKIKSVEIVPGSYFDPSWKEEMYKIITDDGRVFANAAPGTTHFEKQVKKQVWTDYAGKEVIAKESCDKKGVAWLNFCRYPQETALEMSAGMSRNQSESSLSSQSSPAIPNPKAPEADLTADEDLPKKYDLNNEDLKEAKEAYDLIKKGVPAVFLTGGAGTGKSTFIKYLKKNLKKDTGKNWVVLSPTGIAAVNVGGQTIHSFFGLKGDIYEKRDLEKIDANPVAKHTDLIIIDEISMVSSWMMDIINYLLQRWCGNNKPFGGKQMLFVGDLYQLPPIQNDDSAKKEYYKKWETKYFFSSKTIKNMLSNGDFKAVQLEHVFRQDNISFIHMLNRIRRHESGYQKDIDYLNNYNMIEKRLGTQSIPEECLKLSTLNRDVEAFNRSRLYSLMRKGIESKIYLGEVMGRFNFENFLTPEKLELCVGAKVMVTKNLPDLDLANGDMGKVEKMGESSVFIKTENGVIEVGLAVWKSLRYEWDSEKKEIRQVEEGSFSQIPLKLSWAVTIHKSQGLTLDRVAIDASNSWDLGQVYVALSRVRSLKGLFLTRKIPSSAVKTDENVDRFYSLLFGHEDKENAYKSEEYDVSRSRLSDEKDRFTFDDSDKDVSLSDFREYVMIGDYKFNLYPEEGEKIQDHVKRTVPHLIEKRLIPDEEMFQILNDSDYCYETFRIHCKFPKWTAKYTLLSIPDVVQKDNYLKRKYYKEPIGDGRYMLCSQWYQYCAEYFAEWLRKLAEMNKFKAGAVLKSDAFCEKSGYSDETDRMPAVNAKTCSQPDCKACSSLVANVELVSCVSIDDFKQWLIKNGYKPNTANAYGSAINGIMNEEKISLPGLCAKIDSLVVECDVGGLKESLGDKGHKTWINALKRFQEYLAVKRPKPKPATVIPVDTDIVGKKVKHDLYGIGTIIKTDTNGTLIEVSFDKVVKKISYKSLEFI